MGYRLFLTDEEMEVLLHEIGIQDARDDFVYSDERKWDAHREFLYAKLRIGRRGQRATKEAVHKNKIWDAIKDAAKT